MASKLQRRSGVAVVNVAKLLDWVPDVIYQVGIGHRHKEVFVMVEAWPHVDLFGCEPHPRIVACLKDYPGKVFQTAIGGQVGKGKLFDKERHGDGSSLYQFDETEKGGRDYKTIDVDVTTLDEFFVRRGKHVLLWLDCEGSEWEALEGGEGFVEGVEVINIEMTANPPSKYWPSTVEIHCWLMDHGFLRQTTHTTRSHSGQYDAIYVRRHLFRPEICSCPCQIEAYRNSE